MKRLWLDITETDTMTFVPTKPWHYYQQGLKGSVLDIDR